MMQNRLTQIINEPNKKLKEEDDRAVKLRTHLRYFTGSMQLFKLHERLPITYTEGVQYLAEETGAFWLIQNIGIAYHFGDNGLKKEEALFWKLKAYSDNSGFLVCEYDTDQPLYAEYLAYTDFPFAEFTLYQMNGVLLLPSEY